MVLLLSLVVIVVVSRWVVYRYNHIVCSDASVKGLLTKVGARIDGQVIAIEVEPSQRIAKGAVLGRLEDRHLRASVDRARSELQRASHEWEAERLAIEHERRRLTVRESRAQAELKAEEGSVAAAKSNVERWDKDHQRTSSLMSDGLIAPSDLDHVSAALSNAQASLTAETSRRDAAEVNLQLAAIELEGIRVREHQLKVLQSRVAVARSTLAATEADLAATIIRAPEDGWVVRWLVEQGGSVKIGQPIVSLWIGESVWVEAWLDETQVRMVKIGNPADVAIDAYPGTVLKGHVEAIGVLSNTELQDPVVPPTLDALLHQSTKIPIRIALDQPDKRLHPGLSAVVGTRKGEDLRFAKLE
jgi:membrane fusion protein (multidrug efflux system)